MSSRIKNTHSELLFHSIPLRKPFIWGEASGYLILLQRKRSPSQTSEATCYLIWPKKFYFQILYFWEQGLTSVTYFQKKKKKVLCFNGDNCGLKLPGEVNSFVLPQKATPHLSSFYSFSIGIYISFFSSCTGFFVFSSEGHHFFLYLGMCLVQRGLIATSEVVGVFLSKSYTYPFISFPCHIFFFQEKSKVR